jgi:hypothetical protein
LLGAKFGIIHAGLLRISLFLSKQKYTEEGLFLLVKGLC